MGSLNDVNNDIIYDMASYHIRISEASRNRLEESRRQTGKSFGRLVDEALGIDEYTLSDEKINEWDKTVDLELLKDDGGRLITVLYKNTEKLGKIYLIKKIKKKITSRFYMGSHTPILSDFRKNKKEFIF